MRLEVEHAAHQALTWCGIFANNNEYLNFQPNEFGFFGAYTGTEDCLVLNPCSNDDQCISGDAGCPGAAPSCLLFATAGLGPDQQFQDESFFIDFCGDESRTCSVPPSFPEREYGGVSMKTEEGGVFFCGGDHTSYDCRLYDPVAETWEMSELSLRQHRSGSAVVELSSGSYWIIGGRR